MRTIRVMLMMLVLIVAACQNAAESQPTSPPQATSAPTNTPTTAPTATQTLPPTPSAIPPTATPDLSGLPYDLPSYELQPFTYSQSVSGDYVGSDYTRRFGDSGPAIEYGPNAAGGSTLGEGYQALSVMTTVQAAEGGARTAKVMLRFPSDLQPGTYPMVTWLDVSEDRPVGVQVSVTNAQSFNTVVEGTLTVDYLDSQFISGSYDLTVSNRDAQEVTAQASFYLIEYTPVMTFDLTMTGAYEMTGAPGMNISTSRSAGTVLGAPQRGLQLGLKGEDAEGEEISTRIEIDAAPSDALVAGETYDVTAADSPITVEVSVAGEAVTITAGTITFDETLYSWAGSLDLTVETAAGEAVITGTFADVIWNLN